jgi:hypothetical protein
MDLGRTCMLTVASCLLSRLICLAELLKCPDCGNDVSSRAKACPKCGCPVSVTAQSATATRPSPTDAETPVFQRVRNGLVLIESRNGLGSGFVINSLASHRLSTGGVRKSADREAVSL